MRRLPRALLSLMALLPLAACGDDGGGEGDGEQRTLTVLAASSLTGTFTEMDAASVRLAQRIVTLLETRDLALAEQIETDDDRLDDLHADTFTAMLGGGWAAGPQQTVDVTLLGRFYERFGDHGVSIARRIVYLVTGDLSAGEPLHIHG